VETKIDPHDLTIQLFQNGQLRQNSNTSQLIFNSYQVVSFISTNMTLLPGDVIPVAAWIAISLAFPIVGAILLAPLIFIVIAPDVIAYVAIHLRYDTTWYVLTDRSLRIRRGIWVIHETTISFENVQNVEVREGPVQRFFGIADVLVQTAGGGGGHGGDSEGGKSSSLGGHVVILQVLDNAHDVRDLVLDRVKRTRSAGLGDDRVVPSSAHDDGTVTFSPALLAVLRDISDITRRLTP